jgi:hypothetical protein
MPRPRKQTELEAQIGAIISAAAREIAAAVRADVAAQLSRATGLATTGARRGRPPGSKTKQKRTFPSHCIYPGCNNPHKGPGASFFCEEHLKLPKSEREKIKAERKAGAVKPVKRGKGSNGVKTAKSKGRGRRGGIDEAGISRILKVIEDSPGLRSEEIQKKLPISPKLVRAGLAKLRETKRVKTTGEKRQMTYSAP